MYEVDQKNVSDCPYYLIYRVSLLITSSLKKGFAEAGVFDVTPAYLSALMPLWDDYENTGDKKNCGMKANELGKKAGLEPSTMTGLIDRMERSGIVERRDYPNDRRAQLISLTDKGIEIQKAVLNVLTNTLDKVFNGIAERNIGQMKEVLKSVLVNFSKGNI